MGIPRNEVIDFSTSVNPLGTPRSVIVEIRQNLKNLIHYPDTNAHNLTKELARLCGIDPDSILCGNGCTELIYLVPQAMHFRGVLIVQPTFRDYERACRIAYPECFVADYMVQSDQTFDIDPQILIDRAVGSRIDAVILCNPNNPTGRLLERDGLLAVAQALNTHGIYLVVDESFIDFTNTQSITRAVSANSHLIVLRSMTKFYALAGLRLGFGIFPIPIAKKIREYKEPWSTNTLAQAAGIAALNDKGYRDHTAKIMTRQKAFLEKGFRRLGIEFTPSAANYYLMSTPHARIFIEKLARKGIIIRDCSNFKGLDYRYLRVAVKSARHNRFLLECLEGCIG